MAQDIIARLKADTSNFDSKLNKSKSTLQQLGVKGKEAGQMLGQFDKVMGTSIGTLGKLSIATAAVSTALKVMKDAFNSSEGNIDFWNRTVESAQSVYTGFLSSLNNGDISGFLGKIDQIVQAAQDAYNALDDLGTYNAFAQRSKAKHKSNYDKALNDYRLNPTAENKAALEKANNNLINELKTEQGKTEKAYLKGLEELATSRGLTGSDKAMFINTFANASPADFDAAKNGYKAGVGMGARRDYYNGGFVAGGKFYQLDSDGRGINPRKMTDAEMRRFRYAKALGETPDADIQKIQALGAKSIGLSDAVYQQDLAYNRAARNNRLGGGGGGGRTGGKGGTSLSPLLSLSNISGISLGGDFRSESAIGADIKKWQDALKNATSKSMQDEAKTMIKKYEDELKITQHGGDPLSAALSDVTIKSDVAVPALADGGKAVKESWNDAANAIGAVGAAMQGIEDPTIRVVGIIGEAIATIALTFAKSLKGTVTPWDWIAAAASGTATMISTISAIKSATEYHAQGGIVGAHGLSRGTDTVPAMLTPGEIVLNKSQQMNLSRQLSLVGNSMGGSNSYVSGEQLVTVINNYGRRTGRGEILR